jgi:hypothetical protein
VEAVMDQRQSALVEGNRVRVQNADLKKWVRGENGRGPAARQAKAASHRRAAQLLTELHEHRGAGRMRVVQVLTCVRGLGEQRTNRLLMEINCSPVRRLEELSHRQLALLVERLQLEAVRVEAGR